MLKILINSYACSPGMGSEPGMGWNWCIHLAQHCELYIITEGQFKNSIEEELSHSPLAKNMHFYYNEVPEKVRKMCWNQGDWRFYYYYKKWQISTLDIAKEIISKEKIDIIHHLNMIGFREPGYLWEIKNIPFIWGPINAKESIPISYIKNAGWRQRIFFSVKNSINKLQLSFSHRVKKSIERADYVIASSSDSVQSLKKYYGIHPVLINESGCHTPENGARIVREIAIDGTFNIIWVGRFIFTKQLQLALDTITRIKHMDLKLHIVGGSDEEEDLWKNYCRDKKIENNCVWHGKISHKEVQIMMRNCDLFFFTSIAEGTPHVVLEAIANDLPILCFDTCGQGDIVDEKIGIKIPLSKPAKSVQEFADLITYLKTNSDVLKEFSKNCFERQRELSWDHKARQMVALYHRAKGRLNSDEQLIQADTVNSTDDNQI